MTAQGFRPNQMYEIELPSGRRVSPPPGRCWGMVQPEFLKLKEAKRIWFGANGDGRPRVKTYLLEAEGPTAWTWWDNKYAGHNQEGKKEAIAILGAENEFPYPKPSKLIKRILELQLKPHALILDSFAGSGTTAHAALALNKADGGDRRFILIETEKYADTLTAERVRRVIQGVPGAKDPDLKAGLRGSFTYCELGEPMELERFFAGEGEAPSHQRVAEYIAWTATGATLAPLEGPDGFVGHAGGFRLHLIYKPDAKWMRSNDAALDLTTAERIAEAAQADGGKPVLVFAAAKLMGQRLLSGLGLTFCQLPYSVHRILGEGIEGVSGVEGA